jgi:hypothetical protein
MQEAAKRWFDGARRTPPKMAETMAGIDRMICASMEWYRGLPEPRPSVAEIKKNSPIGQYCTALDALCKVCFFPANQPLSG